MLGAPWKRWQKSSIDFAPLLCWRMMTSTQSQFSVSSCVEVGAAAPGVPSFRERNKVGGGVGGVLQVAPLAAGKVIESGGGEGEIVAILVGGEQSAAGGEHEAEIVRQAFVDPEQVVLHGLLVVGRGEVGGAAVLSVPRVNVLVGQQAGRQFAGGVVDQARARRRGCRRIRDARGRSAQRDR